MASVENTEAVEFNRGEAISSSWPYGRSGASTDPVTHFAVCADQHGESVRVMSPFSVPLVLPRGNPVTFGPRSLSIVDIHNIRRGLWNDNPERGEGKGWKRASTRWKPSSAKGIRWVQLPRRGVPL